MLVLTRKRKEKILVRDSCGNELIIEVCYTSSGRVKLGFDSASHLFSITRLEKEEK